jgi:LemA protein
MPSSRGAGQEARIADAIAGINRRRCYHRDPFPQAQSIAAFEQIGSGPMELSSLVLPAVLAALAGWGVVIYNRLVNLKHGVNKTWSDIDVLLRQRHDELPKLVDTCKEYMTYERETLERVISARSRVFQAREAGDVAALGLAEGALRAGLGRLFALAESYPALEANQTFQHLQSRITTLEASIASRRETYNEAVNRNNVAVEQFPDLIVARLFSFRQAQLLRFDEEEKADVDVGALFRG